MSGYNQPRRNFSGPGRGRGGQNNFFRNDRSDRNQSDGDATIITVPSRFVGRIIGRGGSKIAELQNETGAKIIVTKEENDGETTVKLIGSESSIADARSRIDELTVDRERPSRNYNYNSSRGDEDESYQDKVAREIREEMERKKEDKNYIAEEPIEVIDWQKLNEEHSGSRGNFSGPGRGRGGQSNFYRNDRSDRNQSDGDATIITVPSRFVGRIIGRGGSKIAELQNETGAKIIVTKEENDGETTVKLIGSDSSIADAKSRIEELSVDRERPPRD